MKHPAQMKLCFYGDDFTGSTDAMESLALNGVKTMLFTAPPTPRQLAQHPDLQAFGVAGQTRSMSPEAMESVLRPAFIVLRDCGAARIHYKVCSTFDSSPRIGNIGRVIEIGRDIFAAQTVPIVVGAPDLGRYCVFGNLFARFGVQPQPFRLDRHPSMSRHPVTPMDESDLRVHLARQTKASISLFDILQLDQPLEAATRAYDTLLAQSPDAVLIDLLHRSHLPTVGALLEHPSTPFVVGSSGVESALAAHWRQDGTVVQPGRFDPVQDCGPIVAICGSLSPVTQQQVRHAIASGFAELGVDINQPADAQAAIAALKSNKSLVVHTGVRSHSLSSAQQSGIGRMLGELLLKILDAGIAMRVIVAGGDTSGEVARTLKIESMEMIGELTRGAPLCRVHAPGSPADKLEMVFKGGQIGAEGFFTSVRAGSATGA